MKKTTIVLAILLLAGVATAQTMIPLPAFNNTYSSTQTRGFYCQVPCAIEVVGLRVPNEASQTLQNVVLFKNDTAPPAFSGTVDLTKKIEVKLIGQQKDVILPCSAKYAKDDWLIVIGAYGDGTRLYNSYAARGCYSSNINNLPVTLCRCGIQANLVTATQFLVWSENAYNVCRVEVYYNVIGGFICNAPQKHSISSPTPASIDLSGGQATNFYQIAASLGNTMTLNLGTCSVQLDLDGVLLYSVLVGGPYFNSYAGTLVGGAGSGSFAPPANPALVGVDVYHAAASYSTSAVTDCSNTVKTTLER